MGRRLRPLPVVRHDRECRQRHLRHHARQDRHPLQCLGHPLCAEEQSLTDARHLGISPDGGALPLWGILALQSSYDAKDDREGQTVRVPDLGGFHQASGYPRPRHDSVGCVPHRSSWSRNRVSHHRLTFSHRATLY